MYSFFVFGFMIIFDKEKKMCIKKFIKFYLILERKK